VGRQQNRASESNVLCSRQRKQNAMAASCAALLRFYRLQNTVRLQDIKKRGINRNASTWCPLMADPEHFPFPLSSLDSNCTQQNCAIAVNPCKVNPFGETERCSCAQERALPLGPKHTERPVPAELRASASAGPQHARNHTACDPSQLAMETPSPHSQVLQ